MILGVLDGMVRSSSLELSSLLLFVRAKAAGGDVAGAVVVTVRLIELIREFSALSILYQVLTIARVRFLVVLVGVTIGGCCCYSSSSSSSSSSSMMAANGFSTWTGAVGLVGGIGDVHDLLGVHKSSIRASVFFLLFNW